MMKRGWAFLLIGLTISLVYLPSLPGAFHFDDYLLLLDNPDVNSSSFRFASFLDHYGGRPLTLLSFHWNYQLAGREAISYVVFDIALHVLACLLLFGWLQELTGSLPLALGTALLFGLHPLQTQAVNYIWSRSMLLMACFVLACLWTARRGHPVWSLLLFQLAIWSRTEAMAVAPFLLLQGSRPSGILFLLVLNGAGFLTGLIRTAPSETAWQNSHILAYWLAQPAAFLKYLSLMIWPAGLTIDHDFRPSPLLTLASVFLLAGLLYVIHWVWQRNRLASLAGLWTLLWLAPAAAIPNEDLFNESRSYLALAGFAFLVSFLLQKGHRKLDGWRGRTALALVLLGLISASLPRNSFWNDNLGLWREAAERYPNKLRIQYNLGHAQILEGHMKRAEESFRRALNLNPEDDLSYAALGYCAEIKGDWQSARDDYERAVELNRENGYAVTGLERVKRELARFKAQSDFREEP